MDTLANMFTTIRNGLATQKQEVKVPFSKMKLAIAQKLVQEGFLADAKPTEDSRWIYLHLRYRATGAPYIQSINRVSKSGRRVYTPYTEIRKVRSGMGIQIITTSKGIITAQEARQQKVGGEVVCEVY